eukprot:scaffold1066_cov421-Prasinococcus_capsulatus_cf.AAC.3
MRQHGLGRASVVLLVYLVLLVAEPWHLSSLVPTCCVPSGPFGGAVPDGTTRSTFLAAATTTSFLEGGKPLLAAALPPSTAASFQREDDSDSGEGEGGSTREQPHRSKVTEELKKKVSSKFHGPLSAGHDSTPIGVAHVFDGLYPEIFVTNGKLSTEPGLYLYQFKRLDSTGVPVYRKRVQVTHPFKGLLPPTGTVLEVDGAIHGFWLVENNIIAHTHYDRDSHGFTERRELHLQGLPRAPIGLAYLPRSGGGGDLVLEIPDKKPTAKGFTLTNYKDPEYNPHDSDPEVTPRDGGGIWRGGWLHSGLYTVKLTSFTESPSQSVRRASASDHDIQFGYCLMTEMRSNVTGTQERSLVTGSYYGTLNYFRNIADAGIALKARKPLLNMQGQVIRHPSPRSMPVVIYGEDGEPNLIVGGEGALYFYRFIAHTGEAPVYMDPVPVREENAPLYAGSHPSPVSVDWDGDGRIDIVSGDATGFVSFYRNVGTNTSPSFLAGEPIIAGGVPISVQPGYLALEGPAEARFGYTCPVVIDWNNDGLLDIIMSDATSRHTVFLNRGTQDRTKLDVGRPLYSDGLELHGPWRIKPGVAKAGPRMAYVTVDDNDELHVYYRLDDFNLKDGGKLRLVKTGKPIRTHYLAGGATGRLQIVLVDWDLDGVLVRISLRAAETKQLSNNSIAFFLTRSLNSWQDLLIGTPRHGSIPDPDYGLPRRVGLPGGAILFLRGKREQTTDFPHFSQPEILHYDGSPIFIGREDGSLTVTELGGRKGPHLLVAEESGRVIYYDRQRISCDSFHRLPDSKGAVTDVDEPLTIYEMLEEIQESSKAGDEGPGCQKSPILTVVKQAVEAAQARRERRKKEEYEANEDASDKAMRARRNDVFMGAIGGFGIAIIVGFLQKQSGGALTYPITRLFRKREMKHVV